MLRPNEAGTIQAHLAELNLDERNKQANAALQIWWEDLKRIKHLNYHDLSEFSAAKALEAYRDDDPQHFLEQAKALLTQACLEPGKAFHLGGFISAVVDATVPLNPEFAFDIDQQLRGSSLRVNVINEYGASTFTAALWRSARTQARAQAICTRVIHECATDEEIAWQAIIAQTEGAGETLARICEHLLAEPLAKDRALAVSLLAWVPLKEHISLLHKLTTNDPSGWIRTHAAWAAEVAQHEQAVRQYYHATLHMSDANLVSSRLQVMLPALTLSALSWHRSIETAELGTRSLPSETEAAISLFWYRVRSHHGKRPELFTEICENTCAGN